MFRIQMLLVWKWFRRRVLCQLWSEWSMRTQGRWAVTCLGAGADVDGVFFILKMNFWPSGFSGCHSTAHKPGSGCEDGSIVTEQTQRALHHGRQHWMSVKSRPSLPFSCLRSPVHVCVWSARGNTTVCGEFNFTSDPEAAYVVLKEYQCPTYLACWEFTCHSKLSWVNFPLHQHIYRTIVQFNEISHK